MDTTGRDALGIYYLNDSDKDSLMTTYSEVQGTIAATSLSMRLKNTQVEGDVYPGATVVVRRMATSVSEDYGTSRNRGAGRKPKNMGVKVEIDTDKEIVEEINVFDADRYGLPGLIDKRKANHAVSMQVTLDKAYFRALENAASANIVNVSAETGTEDKILKLIGELEILENENVEGVDRELMVLTLAPKWYNAVRKVINAMPNPEGQSRNLFHDVEVHKAPRQKFDAIVQVRGSVAQPTVVYPYNPGMIPLSNEVAVPMFYHFGTKAIMPDCIMAAALDSDISA